MALDVLISIGGKVVELLVEPIGWRLMYIVRPNRNIPKLKSRVEELEALRKGLQDSIDADIRNGQVIRPDVKLWTEKVDKLLKEAEVFPQGGSNATSACFSRFLPNPATRYHQGKWAKEKVEEFGELLIKGANFTNISNPGPPLGIESMPSRSADMTYEAIRSARTKVMEALRDDNINFIGIHGIGGVGKTTLVKAIGKKVKEDKLFDEVVMAVVSQNQDMKKIQSEIASFLGLSLADEPGERARKLYARIKGVKTILVILDDVWANLDLVAIGIPCDNDHQGCKIIITTRREQVCRSMGTVRKRKIVALHVLSEEDSWDLFRSKAGHVVDSPKLNDVAKEVWRECGHLPLALVTVGSAMSGTEDPYEWKEATQQLKVAAPHDIEGVEENVYRSIKLSFDYLKDDVAKKFLLLYSLFPEDHDIQIEYVVRCGWGLRMFRGDIDTVQGARRRAKTLINNLKGASLLLPSNMRGCIKMHDVVRDVAISIGSDKYIVNTAVGGRSLEHWPIMERTMDQYEGISLIGDRAGNYPVAWDFPNLKILMLIGNRIGSSLHSHYLSKLKELNVLHLCISYDAFDPYYAMVFGPRTYTISGLRPVHYAFDHLQTCLRTLILRAIDGPDMATMGKIITLEILDLQGCKFHEAPNAFIRASTNLRVLDLRDTRHDYVKDKAEDNMLSPHLTRLEELYIDNGILSWDDLRIVRNLPRLKVLQACVETMPRDFVYPSQFECFFISLGSREKCILF